MDIVAIGHTLSVWLLPVVMAITIHEVAHGWMAEKLGDDTARRLGRITLNPLRHVDPVGTIVVPLMLVLMGSNFVLGWAKPVPVAFHRLNKPKRDMVWVALAGPAVNILLAIAAALALHGVRYLGDDLPALWLWSNLDNFILINVVLATFNMIPLPPLDGGRIMTGLLPAPYAYRFARLEPYGMLALIAVAILVPMAAEQLGYNFNPLGMLLAPAVGVVHQFVITLAGWN